MVTRADVGKAAVVPAIAAEVHTGSTAANEIRLRQRILFTVLYRRSDQLDFVILKPLARAKLDHPGKPQIRDPLGGLRWHDDRGRTGHLVQSRPVQMIDVVVAYEDQLHICQIIGRQPGPHRSFDPLDPVAEHGIAHDVAVGVADQHGGMTGKADRDLPGPHSWQRLGLGPPGSPQPAPHPVQDYAAIARNTPRAMRCAKLTHTAGKVGHLVVCPGLELIRAIGWLVCDQIPAVGKKSTIAPASHRPVRLFDFLPLCPLAWTETWDRLRGPRGGVLRADECLRLFPAQLLVLIRSPQS